MRTAAASVARPLPDERPRRSSRSATCSQVFRQRRRVQPRTAHAALDGCLACTHPRPAGKVLVDRRRIRAAARPRWPGSSCAWCGRLRRDLGRCRGRMIVAPGSASARLPHAAPAGAADLPESVRGLQPAPPGRGLPAAHRDQPQAPATDAASRRPPSTRRCARSAWPRPGRAARASCASSPAASCSASASRARSSPSPKLIVADEPVSMVDASLRMTIVNLFRQLERTGVWPSSTSRTTSAPPTTCPTMSRS